jgi:hypothetical protein
MQEKMSLALFAFFGTHLANISNEHGPVSTHGSFKTGFKIGFKTGSYSSSLSLEGIDTSSIFISFINNQFFAEPIIIIKLKGFFFGKAMNILKDRPNLLFLVCVRNQNKNFLVVSKLRRAIYLLKMIKALTTVANINGYQEYYLNGKQHRVDGPAIIYPDGYQAYYLNGKLHRVDGPAIIAPNGFQAYWLNGERHRVDGPAIVYSDGTQSYYINGECVGSF